MGRQSHSSYHSTKEVVSASAIAIPQGKLRTIDYEEVDYETPRALETAEVEKIPDDYKNCAKLAYMAGFDGVEIHAANGYLID